MPFPLTLFKCPLEQLSKIKFMQNQYKKADLPSLHSINSAKQDNSES